MTSQGAPPLPPACPADHRKGPRRRGGTLLQAIFDAVLDELAEAGYAELAMDRVAARARTSKASLYRRWPSRAELVSAAIAQCAPAQASLPDTGSLRGDLLALLEGISERLDGPFGEAVRGILAETLSDPQRTAAARARMTSLGDHLIAQILDRAEARGEVRRPGPGSFAARAAPALVFQHYLASGAPIPPEVITGIVDEVALPLLTGPAGASR